MTDDPRDDLDRALASRLGALAGDDDDATAVLEEMRPGLRRARTRHRIARASTAALALAVVVSLAAVVAGGSPRHGRVAVVSPSSTSVQPIRPKPLPPKNKRATATTRPDDTTPTTRPRGGSQTPSPTLAPPAGTPEGGGGGPGPGDGGSGGGTPTTVSAPQTHVYSAPGGTATISCASGRLDLVSWAANSGWTATVHTNSADEKEVRFSRPSSGIDGAEHDSQVTSEDQSRIDVKVNGSCSQLEVETE